MKVITRHGNIIRQKSDALALGIFEGRPLTGAAAAVDRATRGAVRRLILQKDFTGRFLEVTLIYPRGLGAKRLILVGLGAREAFTLARARLAAAAVSRRARDMRAGTLVTVVFGAGSGGLPPDRAAQATAEGVVLGAYRFSAYRTEPGVPLRQVTIVEREPDVARAIETAVERGRQWAEGTCLARDLASTPGQDLTPQRLADRARELESAGTRVEVLDVRRLEKLGMGALLAVGRGSVHPPRFVVLERGGRSSAKTPTVVLIGKGVTFDTGGISLKPRENMGKMKYDMSGAAAVLGAFAALAEMDLPFRVVGLLALAENMPGGRALKPGDIVRAMDGTTIEVTNTDAEGRLVLADALGYARRYEPEVVVDLATLTGAVSIALGNLAAGMFTDDDALASELEQASADSGERIWRLPVWDDYAPEMRGEVADLVNSSGAREGGAILAAVFLKHFARGMRWAHLDIASTAWSPVVRPHEGRGPTGFGVRLLLEWLSRRASASGSSASSRPGPRARRATRSARGRAGASSRSSDAPRPGRRFRGP
ncbi:MAG TPA: leucyl aminopeptidase [Candidatus Eisenbacteria bacterium]|nr:leucyl aminopeptidase [Candidatus Eisenbacteria bacterium]